MKLIYGKPINKYNNPIYHGTCYSEKIIKEGVIRKPIYGDCHVSFSKKIEIAEYFARLPRDSEDNSEGQMAIFIIERPSNAVDFISRAFGDMEDLSDEHEVAINKDILLNDFEYSLLII